MNPLRRSGLRVAALAIACWAVPVVSVVTYDPGDGVPIGAGLFYILAVPLSVLASLILLRSLRVPVAGAGRPFRGRARATMGVAAATLAVATVVILPLVFVGGATDSLPGSTLYVLLYSGLGAFVISTLLFLSLRP